MEDSIYDSTYQSGSVSSADSAAAAAIVLITIVVTLVIIVIVYVIYSIFLGMVYKKAGIEAWKAWVPIYNNWVLLELGGQKGWLALLTFVPFGSLITAVFMYISMYHIGIAFRKDPMLFLILAIFAPIVWVIWLAVDKTAVWDSTLAKSPNP